MAKRLRECETYEDYREFKIEQSYFTYYDALKQMEYEDIGSVFTGWLYRAIRYLDKSGAANQFDASDMVDAYEIEFKKYLEQEYKDISDIKLNKNLDHSDNVLFQIEDMSTLSEAIYAIMCIVELRTMQVFVQEPKKTTELIIDANNLISYENGCLMVSDKLMDTLNELSSIESCTHQSEFFLDKINKEYECEDNDDLDSLDELF